MVIEKIFLSNFQGFGDRTRTEVGQLTLIFGPNASGKSSIGRALRVMKQSAFESNGQHGHTWKGPEIDLGSAKNAIRGQLRSRVGPTKVGLGLKIKSPGVSASDTDESRTPAVSILVTEDVRDSSLGLDFASWGSSTLGVVSYKQSSSGFSATDAYEIGPKGKTSDEEDLEKYQHAMQSLRGYVSVVGNRFRFNAPADNHTVFEEHFWDYDDVEKFFRLTYEATDVFVEELTQMSFIAPIRPVPPKFEVFESDDDLLIIEEKVGSKSIKSAQDLMLRLTGNRYLYQVSVFREPNSGANIRVNQVEDLNSGAKLGFDQVGMGLSQLIPIVEDISNGFGATYVEQPELHLHPKMQGDLMDAFIETLESRDDRQFFLETHSETMLLRAQKRVREGNLDPSKIKVLFVDQATQDDGSSFNSIQELKLDGAGDFLDPLPVSFMDIRMQDLL